ncbi:hypothetical protein [Paracoccus pacificus]|uniref:Hemolysin-type calcium-binding repeat-containing protein n=1 Tax=Paracoccus pacificus TaxID=1463598 RepID=A0ABW4R7M1_9RHOB
MEYSLLAPGLLLLGLLAAITNNGDGNEDDPDPPEPTEGDDLIEADSNDTAGMTVLDGLGGNDTITLSHDPDAADPGLPDTNGGAGDDVITYDLADGNRIDGGDGNDSITVHGAIGSTLEGGAGNDTLSLNAATRTDSIGSSLLGGDGDDVLRVNASIAPAEGDMAPSLTGGAGDDAFEITLDSSTVNLNGTAAPAAIIKDYDVATDKLHIDPNTNASGASYKGFELERLGTVEDGDLRTNVLVHYQVPVTMPDGSAGYENVTSTIVLEGVSVTETMLTNGMIRVDDGIPDAPTEGADLIDDSATYVPDVVGLGGNDTITTVGTRNIDAGNGDDLVSYAQGYSVDIDGGAGNDTIFVGEISRSYITGGTGDDDITLGKGAVTGAEVRSVDAGAGDDTISAYFNGTGDEYFSGPVLAGGAGADTFNVDILNAFQSQTEAGEVVAYEVGSISDFVPGLDTLLIDPTSENDNAVYTGYEIVASDDGKGSSLVLKYDVTQTVNIDGQDVTTTRPGHGVIWLEGVTDLKPSDFTITPSAAANA